MSEKERANSRSIIQNRGKTIPTRLPFPVTCGVDKLDTLVTLVSSLAFTCTEACRSNIQRSAKVFVRGCEKFVIALAYLFCLALVGSCLARFAYFLADLCIWLWRMQWHAESQCQGHWRTGRIIHFCLSSGHSDIFDQTFLLQVLKTHVK